MTYLLTHLCFRSLCSIPHQIVVGLLVRDVVMNREVL